MSIADNIKAAYELISRLSVSGDAVDVLAAVRTHLKEAYKEAIKDGAETDRRPSESGER